MTVIQEAAAALRNSGRPVLADALERECAEKDEVIAILEADVAPETLTAAYGEV